MAVVTRGGQRAVTGYAIEAATNNRQLVRLFPETGRTHQLRVHLAHLGAPILGDRLYGPQPPTHPRLLLHAEQISLPAADDFPARTFDAPVPSPFGTIEPHYVITTNATATFYPSAWVNRIDNRNVQVHVCYGTAAQLFRRFQD
ncbi:Ribosomal large subunit pseudouridine synthase A [Anatilimnocola aggregata]|uniref:Ribosomal large subunit pseudouridine synthase A n=2 Tax=Anatilimnocola aggregata TaxID=2528021 RepID=A0A517Y986_9BACT|nr:Ribosomal large subunit pseudouridine synthase A [Anatilimnocola aggregata]